jgi:hypothetical protein
MKVSPIIKIKGIQHQGYLFLANNANIMQASIMALAEDYVILRLLPDKTQLILVDQVHRDFEIDINVDYVDILISASINETRERVQIIVQNLPAFLANMKNCVEWISFFDMTVTEFVAREQDFFLYFLHGGKFQVGMDADIIPLLRKECDANRGYAVDSYRVLSERFGYDSPYSEAQELIAFYEYTDTVYRIFQTPAGDFFHIRFDGLGRKYLHEFDNAADVLMLMDSLVGCPVVKYDAEQCLKVVQLLRARL